MLSCFAKLVPCRDIMICPKPHSELKIGIGSSLDNYCSYLHLTGFLPVLPRGQETFFFIKQKQRCLSKYCEIPENRFVACAGRSGTVYLDQQQHLSVVSFEKVFDWGDLVLPLFNPKPGTGSLASVDLLRRICGAFQAEIPLSFLGHRLISRLRREINLLFLLATQLAADPRIWFVRVILSAVKMLPFQPWE